MWKDAKGSAGFLLVSADDAQCPISTTLPDSADEL